MNLGRVKNGNIGNIFRLQNQRKFATSWNQALDIILFLHFIDHGNQACSCLIHDNPFYRFAHILIVNKLLISFIRSDYLYAIPGESLGIEFALPSKLVPNNATFSSPATAIFWPVSSQCLLVVIARVHELD